MARNTGRGSRIARNDPQRHMHLKAKSRGGSFGKRPTLWRRIVSHIFRGSAS